MRVLHLWDTYSPALFDYSFAMSRDAGLDARLIAMQVVGQHALLPGVTALAGAGDGAARSRFGRALNRLTRARRVAAFRRAVATEIAERAPDVVHVHYGTTAAALLGVQGILGRNTIVSFYGFDVSQGVRDPRIATRYRALFRSRPYVHVLCDEAKARLIALGCDPARIVEANLPLPIERYPDVGLAADRVSRWLLPARFVEKKGHVVLLDAMIEHLKAFPDARLTCWGYGSSEWLNAAVAARGLLDRVTVIDNRLSGDFDTAYLEQLTLHDAIVAPSVTSSRGDDEGGPALTAVAAQLAGKPVILSDFPGSERSVSDGVEGLIVPQGDAVALAGAMARLARNPAEARAFGAAGRARTQRDFSMDAYRGHLFDWYASAAA